MEPMCYQLLEEEMHIGERDNVDSVLKISGGEDACWGVLPTVPITGTGRE